MLDTADHYIALKRKTWWELYTKYGARGFISIELRVHSVFINLQLHFS